MLARSDPLPTGTGWRFEPKLDGFRCLVCTHGGRFRAKSRRGRDMTTKLAELALSLRPDVQLDGELIAWSEEGPHDFHRLGRRMRHGDQSIPVTYIVFEVLALDGEPTLRLRGIRCSRRSSIRRAAPGRCGSRLVWTGGALGRDGRSRAG